MVDGARLFGPRRFGRFGFGRFGTRVFEERDQSVLGVLAGVVVLLLAT